MKKFIALILSAVLCVCIISFAGCTDDKKACEGIYYFHDGTGELPGYGSCYFDIKDEETGLYPNVVGGVVDFTKFYIELKDGKMTVHGSITHAVTPQGLKVVVNPDTVEEYTYTLVSREGYYGYNIYVDGEDTGYHVSPPYPDPIGSDYDKGYISYSYGSQGKDLYVIFNWTQQQATKFLQN